MSAPRSVLEIVRASIWTIVVVALVGWYVSTQILFPVQVKAVSSIACDEAHPDVFIVQRDVERNRRGRRTNSFVNELWCMADDGAVEKRSLLRGSLPLLPVYLLGSAGAAVALARARDRRERSDDGPVSPILTG